MKKTIVASIIALTMGVGGVGAAAQFHEIGEGAKKVGQATKDVGKATVDTTKKAVGTAGKETKKATKKVTGVRCADGTHQSTKTGCAHHGGIRK